MNKKRKKNANVDVVKIVTNGIIATIVLMLTMVIIQSIILIWEDLEENRSVLLFVEEGGWWENLATLHNI